MTEGRTRVLQMIQEAAERAAKSGVEVKVEYSEFGFDGRYDVTVTATPPKTPSPSAEGK